MWLCYKLNFTFALSSLWLFLFVLLIRLCCYLLKGTRRQQEKRWKAKITWFSNMFFFYFFGIHEENARATATSSHKWFVQSQIFRVLNVKQTSEWMGRRSTKINVTHISQVRRTDKPTQIRRFARMALSASLSLSCCCCALPSLHTSQTWRGFFLLLTSNYLRALLQKKERKKQHTHITPPPPPLPQDAIFQTIPIGPS